MSKQWTAWRRISGRFQPSSWIRRFSGKVGSQRIFPCGKWRSIRSKKRLPFHFFYEKLQDVCRSFFSLHRKTHTESQLGVQLRKMGMFEKKTFWVAGWATLKKMLVKLDHLSISRCEKISETTTWLFVLCLKFTPKLHKQETSLGFEQANFGHTSILRYPMLGLVRANEGIQAKILRSRWRRLPSLVSVSFRNASWKKSR